ncbi:hypothetical protein FBQ87_00535 [Sphingobacteriales bacterium CHB3]|nr:hypothetical protein [Sphingobacteriales bacterium CHB3]
MKKAKLLAIVVAAAMVSNLSCKEPLPGYQDPRDVFDAYQSGTYALSTAENAVKAYFTVFNAYDETFDARAVLNGTLTIIFERDRTFRKTVQLGPSTIIEARGYDPASGNLRMDPGDSVRFGFSWNMIADDGRSLFNTDLVTFYPNPECPPDLISTQPVRLTIESNVRMYDRTEIVVAPQIRLEFILHRRYVPPRDC